MNKFKNTIIFIIFSVLLFSSFYILEVENNKSLVVKISNIEKRFSLELEKLNKKIDKLTQENKNLSILISKNNVNNSDIINTNKNINNSGSLKSVEVKRSEIIKSQKTLKDNNFYYSEALKNLDSTLCNKIKNDTHKLEICIKKIEIYFKIN